MALMIGAMIIQGIGPGPNVVTEQPDLFWGMIASMWVGNLMLVVLNLPLIGHVGADAAIPYRLLFPAILLFCVHRRLQREQQPFAILLAACFGLAAISSSSSTASRHPCCSASSSAR